VRAARCFLAALFGVTACAPVWALDLLQSYQAALEQDPTILSIKAGTDARRERIPQTDAQLLPNISWGLSRTRNALDSVSPNSLGAPVSSSTEYTSSTEALTLRQPLFNAFKSADQRQARAQVEDAEAILAREMQNLAVRVTSAYCDALLSADQLALVQAQKRAVTGQLDAARKRFIAGVGTRTDIDEAQAALDLNAAQELEALQQVEFTRRQLQALINVPLDELAVLDANRMLLQALSPDRLEDWIERAEANSPEVRSLKAQHEAARLDVEKAQAGHYPTLDAIAQVTRSESDSVISVNSRYNNRTIGLQLNLPIYAGGYVSSTVRQAQAEQSRLEYALEALRRDLGVRVHREFRNVTEGVLKVRAMEQAVRSSEQLVLSNRRSFEAGSRTLNDTLNSEQQRFSARRDLAVARYAYLLGRVRLQALIGAPSLALMEEINHWMVPQVPSVALPQAPATTNAPTTGLTLRSASEIQRLPDPKSRRETFISPAAGVLPTD